MSQATALAAIRQVKGLARLLGAQRHRYRQMRGAEQGRVRICYDPGRYGGEVVPKPSLALESAPEAAIVEEFDDCRRDAAPKVEPTPRAKHESNVARDRSIYQAESEAASRG